MRKTVFTRSIKILIITLLLLAVFFQKERSQKLMALALILWIAVAAGIFLLRKFDSEDDLLQWFRERGGITADSAQALL